ncbi:hypothetical protein B0H14DRAFT_3083488 [Mycena olivaceomarginata]|nr:hypothetical protein B0H14DRAFT_3083488 [Mycena olivaceomarginata]
MTATVRDLILILQVFFPDDLSLHKALYLFGVIISLYPLLRLHLNQRHQPRQPAQTAWMKAFRDLLIAAFRPEDEHSSIWAAGLDQSREYADYICEDLASLYMMLGLNPYDLVAPSPPPLSSDPRTVLCTPHLSCVFCPAGDLNITPTLRRVKKPHSVEADLTITHCASCQADYHPDCITYRDNDNHRLQRLETTAQYIRMSKHGENMLNQFHSGWLQTKNDVRQSQRLFIEHFSRRLLLFHNKHANFTCEGQPSTRSLTEAVRATIGENGGVLATAMTHGCVDCTHIKRYCSDLVNEGILLGTDLEDVAGMAASATDDNAPELAADDVVDQLGLPQQQAAPQAGTPRRYIRLAVMDGKTIQHRKCALHLCEGPLVNYKNGRFCQVHLDLADLCGIIPCGRPVHQPGQQYNNRFSRLSSPGVQRVIRRQQMAADNGGIIPALRVELGPLGDTPGDQVVHTFRAKSIYSCGFPIGWGKCYRSESPRQVLAILDRIWLDHPQSKPSFVAYNDACSLLRHIITQDPHSAWLRTTKFVVDAWHYIGHRATYILCRLWCNPAPTNGSQPDLILVEEDANGTKHQTRAFNTETAEQLNSWLNGFESQLRQMSDVNYDFFIHQVDTKDLGLSDEFWAEATGLLNHV